jgi:hypothetical protein
MTAAPDATCGKQQVHIARKRARPTEPAGTLCERFNVFYGWSWDEDNNRGRRYGESYEEMARICDGNRDAGEDGWPRHARPVHCQCGYNTDLF